MKLLIIVFILIVVIVTFLKYNRGSFTNFNHFEYYYKSTTQIGGKYEIYSEKDMYYPSYKVKIDKIKIFKKLLKFADVFFQKNQINYSIDYGTLLGYIRNKKFIPYDEDLDCVIGVDSISKLIKLGNNKKIKNIMFNNEIHNYKPDFNSTQIYLILNYSLLHNNGYGKRYSCNGEESKNQQDACSYNGLFGRFILHSTYYDISTYNKRTAQLKKHVVYTEKISDMSVINTNNIMRDKLENINISVFTKQKSIQLLKLYYGDQFIKPNFKG